MAQDTLKEEGTNGNPPPTEAEAQVVMDELKTVTQGEPVIEKDSKHIDNMPLGDKGKGNTAEINIGEGSKEPSETKVKMNFVDSEFFKKKIKEKTPDAPKEEDSVFGDKNKPKRLVEETPKKGEELPNLPTTTEDAGIKKLDAEESQMVSEFIIDGVDWLASAGLMWLAKDNTDKPYTLDKAKADKLKKQLAFMMARSDKKMSIPALFAMTAALAFIKPVKEALKNRKIVNKGEEAVKQKELSDAKKEREIIADKAQKEKDKIILKDKIADGDEPEEAIIIKEELNELKEEKFTADKLKLQVQTQPDLTERDLDAILLEADKLNLTTPNLMSAIATRRRMINGLTENTVKGVNESDPVFIDVVKPKAETKVEIKEEEKPKPEKEKPTAETKVDKDGKVVLDRKQGNPKGARRSHQQRRQA